MCTVFLMVTNSLVLSLTNIQKLGGGGGANFIAQKYFFLFLPFLYLFDLKDWARKAVKRVVKDPHYRRGRSVSLWRGVVSG